MDQRGEYMIIRRRNTWSDKGISFACMMTAVLIMTTNIKMYQVLGVMNGLDVICSIGGILFGALFLYTSKMKYLELEKDYISWYTWFFVKHTLKREEIKDIKMKTYYIIIVKQNNKEVWIPTRCVKVQDLEEGKKVLKTYAIADLEEVEK